MGLHCSPGSWIILWDCTALLAAALFAAWSQPVCSQTCYDVLPVLQWEVKAQSPFCSTWTSPCCDWKLKSWSQVSLSRVGLPLVQVKPFSNASAVNGYLANTIASAFLQADHELPEVTWVWLFLALSFLNLILKASSRGALPMALFLLLTPAFPSRL